jgi:hypothetical protein
VFVPDVSVMYSHVPCPLQSFGHVMRWHAAPVNPVAARRFFCRGANGRRRTRDGAARHVPA